MSQIVIAALSKYLRKYSFLSTFDKISFKFLIKIPGCPHHLHTERASVFVNYQRADHFYQLCTECLVGSKWAFHPGYKTDNVSAKWLQMGRGSHLIICHLHPYKIAWSSLIMPTDNHNCAYTYVGQLNNHISLMHLAMG